ncbi:hypothetical protein SNOG_11201 [Parastagonospora nodorum SN15]|uniref:Uncharacterized protein n=1 Tax=Phaeosphaeria nodorum (strain SN15 / ATCC MYA-4574 / FGSC 10173) TaxID=321614 RepID=Q0UAL3_PHANO|nr:hypothetical protein SNOG_11201 [Parastagonospora nodorum SN15]EAT81700.1 hypothetical protein SNOG_11201 [Parastagonospora nodorum SN15]
MLKYPFIDYRNTRTPLHTFLTGSDHRAENILQQTIAAE